MGSCFVKERKPLFTLTGSFGGNAVFKYNKFVIVYYPQSEKCPKYGNVEIKGPMPKTTELTEDYNRLLTNSHVAKFSPKFDVNVEVRLKDYQSLKRLFGLRRFLDPMGGLARENLVIPLYP